MHRRPMRTCNRCQQNGSIDTFITCPACGAIYYCSETCRQQDLVHPFDDHGHNAWCTKMAAYRALSDELAHLPFTYARETTASDFDEQKLRLFLERYGVYNVGYWRHLCPQNLSNQKIALSGVPVEGTNKSSESLLLWTSGLVAPPVPLQSWTAYYEWRGLEFDSPVAAVLQFPLTVYYVISTLLPRHGAGEPHDKQLTVHLLGVEQEAEMVPLFAGLDMLLQDTKVCIAMIGPKLSKKLHGKIIEIGNVKVSLHRGLYHKHTSDCPPDVVIGLNAGLAAYPTWLDTLTTLSRSRTPAYFTDYCQYSCECSRLPVEALHLGTISKVEINPFRSPLRKYCEEHDMPWYSNAFVYHLVYVS